MTVGDVGQGSHCITRYIKWHNATNGWSVFTHNEPCLHNLTFICERGMLPFPSHKSNLKALECYNIVKCNEN